MPHDRTIRADALLTAALDLPQDERDGFVGRECGGDEALRRLVLTLLADAERPDDFLSPGAPLDGALWRGVVDSFENAGKMPAGTAVGAWRIVREIGAGGMAVVYLAERVVGEFEQQAALKLIKAGVDTEEMIHRFRQERQILASLNHPNISRLLDGGVSLEGRPFFAMEHIEGLPIDRWCDERRLPVEERLRLFVEAGHAVEFAHQHLVVHRDLKPSNILVTERGQVKLLDFGIAKLLDPATVSHAAPPTRTAVRVMTPQYASPEQIRGEVTTTASDVYQLGLLLYQLLTGRRAQDMDGVSPAGFEQAVCERIPARPSAVAGDERLRRRLRGDLDNIVMKALHKEPPGRYASAADLVADVERHLHGRPVIARPPTLRYRAGRFVRRNTVAVAIGSLLLVSILAGLVTSVRFARVASMERDRARQEAATARRVSDFLIGTFELADPGEARGNAVTAVEILDSGARQIGTLGGEPEIQATMKDVMGRVYLSLGLHDPAALLLTEALQTRRSLFPSPSEAEAESLDHLGRALHEKGAYDEAEDHLRRALEMRRSVLGGSHVQVADSLRNIAVLKHFRGKLDEAETLYREALEIRRQAQGPRHPDVATVIRDLGKLDLQRSDPGKGVTAFQEALEIQQQEWSGDHPEIAATLHALGMAWHNKPDLVKAEDFYRQALEMRVRVLGPDHTDTASTRGNLGALLYQQRDYEKAEPIFRETLEVQRRRLGKDHPVVATSMTNLAVLLSVRGDWKASEPFYREALAIRIKAYGEDHPSVAISRYYLARLMAQRGDEPEAEKLMRVALPRMAEKDPNRAALCVELGELLLTRGKLAEAGTLIQQGLDLSVAIHGADFWRTAAARSARGAWRLARKEHALAGEDLQQSWTVLSKQPIDDARRKKNLERLAALEDARGNPDEAARHRAMLAGTPP
ncbi:MAG: tetratricopeptide repeat protein [Candidatus Polarisedimenticolia bacterium]